MKILVGTNNEKKLEVVRSVLKQLSQDEVKVSGISVDSKVPEAPIGRETLQGAYNRATECLKNGGHNFYVGVESGLVKRYGYSFEEAWAVILHNDNKYIGYSSGLLLPKIVIAKMEQGILHNKIMEELDEELNLPKNNRDTWSRYSGGAILRNVSLEEALRNAFIQALPAKNSLYPHSVT